MIGTLADTAEEEWKTEACFGIVHFTSNGYCCEGEEKGEND
jgi:hypothetical protein